MDRTVLGHRKRKPLSLAGAKAYLEPDEVALLEKSTTNLRDRLLIRLLFRLGCRVSEALGIMEQDIDLVKSTVTIQHLKTRWKLLCPDCSARLSKSHTYCPKCGTKVAKVVAEEKEHRRVRTLPIDDDTLGMLKDYISRGGPVSRKGKRLIFGINRHRAWQVVRDCAERVALPDLINPETGKRRGVSPHRLRDAFAVHAVKIDDSGDGLRLLQEQLGHASFNNTALAGPASFASPSSLPASAILLRVAAATSSCKLGKGCRPGFGPPQP